MPVSRRRIAVLSVALIALWSASLAHVLVPAAAADSGGMTAAWALAMDDCADCPPMDGAGKLPAPCSASCAVMALLTGAGPDAAPAVSPRLLPGGHDARTGRSAAPDPNPPQRTSIG